MKLLLISSSTRPGRASHGVALALQNAFSGSSGVEVDLLDLAEVKLPLFEGRYGIDRDPTKLSREVDARLRAVNAAVIVTPEYNGMAAPALKNLIDSFEGSIWARRPVALCTASGGGFAGMRCALHLQTLFLGLQAIVSPKMLLVGNVENNFSPEGKIIGSEFHKKVDGFVADTLWLSRKILG